MTGVASQICSNPDAILKYKIETDFKKQFDKTVSWGTRNAICSDLSPVATLIASNYNSITDPAIIDKELQEIIKKAENKFRWCYETIHDANGKIGEINYTVWSEVFSCPIVIMR